MTEMGIANSIIVNCVRTGCLEFMIYEALGAEVLDSR